MRLHVIHLKSIVNHPFCKTEVICIFFVWLKNVLFKREEKLLRNRKYFDTDLVDYSKQILDFAVALNSQKFGLHDNTHILCDVEIYQNSGKGKMFVPLGTCNGIWNHCRAHWASQ